MKMHKLASRLLYSRKKWLFLIVFSLSFIIATTSSIFTASESIKMGLKENAYEKYGQHSHMLINIDETKTNLKQKFDRVGQFQIVDEIALNNKIALIGWMDQDAIEIGRIKLLAGSFPIGKNEVAIESSYLKLIDENWNLGEKKTFKLHDQLQEFILVGIIDNYSWQWTVPYTKDIGKHIFPNIFISKNEIEQYNFEKESNNFLIQINGSSKKAANETSKLIELYDHSSVIYNENLFNKGLIDYNTISTLSFIFQIFIFMTSILCISSLFSYFNIEQIQKVAILRALGANKQNIYYIYFYKCIIIFSLSLLVSLPLHVLFHILIVKNTYAQSLLSALNLTHIFSVIVAWFLIIFGSIYWISIKEIRKYENLSINELIKGKVYQNNFRDILSKYTDTFIRNQLRIQLLSNPKQLVLTIITFSLSILIISYSLFLQKESAGIWDIEDDYYLNSQEVYGYDTMENLNVLFNQGLTFPFEEVKELQNMSGIKYVEKNPFMIDVHPLMKPEIIPPILQEWINYYGSPDYKYAGELIIPNVKYVIVDEKEFKQINKKSNYEDLKGKVLLYVPIELENVDKNKIIGEEINFIKKYRESNNIKIKKWNFEILDILNEPLVKKIDDLLLIEDQKISIVIAEETALEQNIFPGYIDLTVFMDNNITKEDSYKIHTILYDMVSTIPGSMFQDISEFIIEDQKISVFVGYLGKLAFFIAVLLSVISVVVIVFSKYYINKRKWGIYLSLGMSKEQLVKIFKLEMNLYLIISTLISILVFIITIGSYNTLYPYYIYLIYFGLSVLLIYVFIFIGGYIINISIKKQDIYSLIRIDE